MNPPPHTKILIERNVPCKVSDGTVLLSDIFRPDSEGKFPVLLHRTPYDKDNIALGIGAQVHPVHAAREGYVVIVQDVRGRFASEGYFDVFTDEARDGRDTIRWAASLPYSNGRVGMFGGSYTGVTQILAATTKPQELVAVSPRMTGANYYDGWTYQGGAFLLAFNFLWSADLAMNELNRMKLSARDKDQAKSELVKAIDDTKNTFASLTPKAIEVFRKYNVAKYFYDWLDHPSYDDFWKKIDPEVHYDEMTIAGLHIAGWYDVFLSGTIRNYLELSKRASKDRSRRGQKLIIGPWVHGTGFLNLIGEWNSGYLAQGSVWGIESMQLRWFNYWLKGEQNGIMEEPSVYVYVMGENKWRSESEWPLERTRYTKFYLDSRGAANTLKGDGFLSETPAGRASSDTYAYDPLRPVPTRGGATTGDIPAALPDGVYDQQLVEHRDDVLVYTSQVLDGGLETTGPVRLALWASSSQRDTDFTAKLTDVAPDGYSRILCDGIIRGRYRESFESPTLLTPYEKYEFHVDLIATSNLFKNGHRIRLEVSSSNFPKFDRNPNTGDDYSSSRVKTAVQTVYHGIEHPSYLLLPVIPRN